MLITYLNSTMVRLKQNKIEILKKEKQESQFHYGSIKTKVVSLIGITTEESQFHYGSIKTHSPAACQ